MTVGSRPSDSVNVAGVRPSSRLMLDDCGIDVALDVADRCSMAVESRQDSTVTVLRDVSAVAIDARWLWNRDRSSRFCSEFDIAVAIDARWLWNRDSPSRHAPHIHRRSRDRCSMAVGSRLIVDVPERVAVSVAIDARWLWDRDLRAACTRVTAMSSVAIDARWLWDRDFGEHARPGQKLHRRDRCSMAVGSRHADAGS